MTGCTELQPVIFFTPFFRYLFIIILSMWPLKQWRRKILSQKPMPLAWLSIISSNCAIYRKLISTDKEELHRHILIFLAEKRFVGCSGLEITDEIKLTIAANACVLLLHRKTDYFPGLRTILVYPAAYVAKQTRHLPGGIVEEGYDVRSGESWPDGSVVLSWDDVKRDAADVRFGRNVVLHEFAHQLDSSFGKGDSSDILKRPSAFVKWARVLYKNYLKLQKDLGVNKPTLLGSYAAEDPAEFFAVATENFFTRPKQLQKSYPDLYRELKKFYHQDPASI